MPRRRAASGTRFGLRESRSGSIRASFAAGDAWDQQIRHQIRGCALFIPIISAHTQTRLEGYFRREWRLAVDRTQDMADDKPFLVPVVINDIDEVDAHVPGAFRAVHWTRLPGGETSSAFAQHVSQLLERGVLGFCRIVVTPSVFERKAQSTNVLSLSTDHSAGKLPQYWSVRLLSSPSATSRSSGSTNRKLGPATWTMPSSLRNRPQQRECTSGGNAFGRGAAICRSQSRQRSGISERRDR
jgi:hypothetical protein